MPDTEIAVSLGRLLRCTEAVHKGRELDDLLRELIFRAGGLPGVDTVRILLVDPQRPVLLAQGGIFPDTDAEGDEVPIGCGFAGTIAQQCAPLLVPDLDDFPVHGSSLQQAGVRSAVGVPLLAGHELLGVMHIGSREPHTFGPELIPTLSAIAERVALTIQAILSERSLAASERRFRALFQDAPIGVCLVDLRPECRGHIMLANNAMARITGYSSQALTGMAFARLLDRGDRPAANAALEDLARGEVTDYVTERQAVRADGSRIWLRGSVTAVLDDGQPNCAVSYIEDVTARKDAERELARRALSDPLTGLANRHRVIDHLTLALRQQMRSGTSVGVLYLDLDRFKDINDAYGHEVGDRVLREVAHRLTVTIRAADTAGRLGGDEFIVVCPNLSSAEELATISERLLRTLTLGVALGDAPPLEVGVSIGAAIGDRNTGPDELLRRADVAMYEAKRRGRHRWHAYAPVLDEASQQRLAAEALLYGALHGDWFRLHYQPIVDLHTGETVSAEALLRIAHPKRGLLLPGAFIDQLEESDLSEPIENWVLNEACRQMRLWRDCGQPPLSSISVNVSGKLAGSGRLTDLVMNAVRDAGIDPRLLCLEFTERVIVQGGDSVLSDLQRLTDCGVTIAIDDFGTGYSSLAYLQRFPVSAVKVDKSFVAGLGTNPRDSAIVSAVAALGDALGVHIIAEGVESEHQAAALRAIGCGRAQGYLFGAPGAPDELC